MAHGSSKTAEQTPTMWCKNPKGDRVNSFFLFFIWHSFMTVLPLCTMLYSRQMIAIDILLNSVGCIRADHMFRYHAYIGNIELCVWH